MHSDRQIGHCVDAHERVKIRITLQCSDVYSALTASVSGLALSVIQPKCPFIARLMRGMMTRTFCPLPLMPLKIMRLGILPGVEPSGDVAQIARNNGHQPLLIHSSKCKRAVISNAVALVQHMHRWQGQAIDSIVTSGCIELASGLMGLQVLEGWL